MQRSRKLLLTLAPLVITALILVGCGGTQPAPAPAAKPAPAQTPAPAAPAAAPAQAAPAGSAGDLLIYALPVRGSANLADAEKADRSCVPQTKFKRNEKITWLIKVIDPKTNASLDDKALGTVTTRLASGEVIEAKWGPRPGQNPTDHYWANGWVIPENYPAGVLKWTITAESKDGRKSQLINFNSATVDLIVLNDKVPVIPPPPAKK